MTKSGSKSGGKPSFTPKDASRIQTATAVKQGGAVPAGSFAAKVQRIVAKNEGGGGNERR